MSYKILLVSLISIFVCDTGFSQNKDSIKYTTDQINVISNKIATDIFFSPSKVQLIGSKEIENKNGETLSDILQIAGGVFLKVYGGSGSLSTISTNGLGAEHTLVLLNGFKLNSSQNAQIDLSTVSKDNIERVEVMNNGSSSIYGSEAIGGVVNIITKNSIGKDFYFKINGQLGSYKQRKIGFEANKSTNNFNCYINLSKESSLNNYQYYFNNGIDKIIKERANSNYEVANYSFNLNFKINPNSKMILFSNYSDIMRNIPGIEAGSEASKATQLDNNWNNILSYENGLSKNVYLKSQINFQNNLSHYSDLTITNSFYKNIYISHSSQINYSKNYLEIIPGYEVSYAALMSNEVEDKAIRVQTSFYLVSEITPFKLLKVFPSVRCDHISDLNQYVFTGKFGINYRPIESLNWNFKSSFGNNFTSPTLNELYWKDLGNKNLKPESSLNFDAGMIFGFELFSKNILEITYTNIEAKDKIVWSPNSNGLWSPKNIGRSTANIFMLEINAGKDLSKNFNATIGFKYSNTRSLKKSVDFTGDPSYDKQIFYVPDQLVKCNIYLKYKESGLNIFYCFTGKRFTDFENNNFLPAVDMFELNFCQNLKFDKFNTLLKLEVNNLFNKDYQIISGYPMPLRNYKINLSFEY